MKITESPLVSIIMPAYNAEKTIKSSIDSILCQSYSNLEIIIVDDGSKDNTAKIINPIIANTSSFLISSLDNFFRLSVDILFMLIFFLS